MSSQPATRARSTPRRLMNWAVAVAVVITSAVPFAAANAQGVACGEENGRWVSIPGPSFKSGPQEISSLAVDAVAPNRIFAANTKSVMWSENDGCSWPNSLTVSAAFPVLGADAIIRSIGLSERGGSRLWVLVEGRTGPVPSPHVIVVTTSNGNGGFADAGLPPAGTPELLRVSPSDPDVAYITIDVAGAADVLYGTNNGGTSWSLRSRISAPNDLKIDPQDPGDLWLGAADGLYHSTDGGQSFAAIDHFANKGSVGPVDVYHAGGPARVMAFAGSTGEVSANDGKTWLSVGIPAPPNSIAHGDFPESMVIATRSSVYAFAPAVLNWVDLEPPRAGIRGMVAERNGEPDFYGHTARTIEIYVGPQKPTPPPEQLLELPDISLIDAVPPDLALQSKLTPGSAKVKIPAGKSETVDYKLTVPRTLTPLDVMFVVDTSSSMTQVIQEAAQALELIHNGLATSGAAVEFGLVEYRSYPTDVPPDPTTDNYVYQRVLDIGASAFQMEEAFRGLVAAGGGIYDAQLEALWQTATGSGVDTWPPGPSSRDVPPGLQAGFRKKALRVILHVGDEPFGKESNRNDNDNVTRPESQIARPDIPEFEAVAEALREKDIKHLGLSLYPDATPDLRRMARATNSFAPPGGVDCDRDGSTDVPEGAPLVCVLQQAEITEANMAPAIVELVEAVRTKSVVGLSAKAERNGVVKGISPDRYDQVLLQADNTLEFEVEYFCPKSLAGKTTDVDLMAKGLIGTAPVAEASVVCGEIERERPPTIHFPQVLALIPLIPLGPPPPPVNVSSATQAQAQAQANAAFAAQEQEQPQVAFAHQLHREIALAREEEYSFSVLRREPEMPSPLPLGAAALLMSAAFGVAMRTSHRVRLSVARARRR